MAQSFGWDAKHEVDGLGLAESRPTLLMETSCYEAEPSDRGFVPGGAGCTE